MTDTFRTVRPLREGDRTVVIGGGPAGLTAAYLLAKRGQPVTVLEGTDCVGGISRTAQYKGYRFDIGGHRFFTKIPPVQDLWDELLGDEFITVPRLSRILYRGKFFHYPLRASNAVWGLGLKNTMHVLLSYLRWSIKPHPVEDNFEQWVTNRFGRRLYEIFFKTYTEKVWGRPCTEIRAEWAAQRIQSLSLAQALLTAASLNRRSTKIKTLISEFRYPRLGPGQMWEVCRDRIEELGGDVLMQHRVTEVVVEGDEAVAVRTTTPHGVETFGAEHVISTMPIRSLTRALRPVVRAPVDEAAGRLDYRDFVVVALMVEGANLFPDNWIYVHTPGVKVGRIQNFGNWSRAMVPVPGVSCIGLEYFCFEGDNLWIMEDAELVALAKREVGQLGLVDPEDVFDGTVVRMPKAYPVYDRHYSDNLATVRRHIDQFNNLHPIGRNGMHKYNNQDHSMLTAMLTIANMDGARHDVWAVNTDYEYHEELELSAPTAAPATLCVETEVG